MKTSSAEKRSLAVLLANSHGVKSRYPQLFDGDFNAHVFATFVDFRRETPDRAQYSGVVLDMKTWLNFTREEKSLFETYYRGKMPVLDISFQTGIVDTVSMRIFDRRWQQFAHDVSTFEPKPDRHDNRRTLVMGAEICRGSYWSDERKIRAFTSNLSPGGCFVVSAEDLRPNERVLVRLGNFPEPIACRVAWRRPLDASREQMPGIGIEFEDIDPSFGPRIRQLLNPEEYV